MSVFTQWKQLQKTASKINTEQLTILYHKNGLLAIQKPYGIPVHSGPKVKHSITSLFPELESQLELPKRSLALANRLDKNVSGVLLLTYNQVMATRLAELYRQRLVRKKYLAVLVGNSKNERGTLTGNIEEELGRQNNYKQRVKEKLDDKETQAQTDFQILDHNKKTCMLCAFETSTGYKHQIRVHSFQLLNSPILGDHKYHGGERGPQTLPLRLLQFLRMEGVQPNSMSKRKIRPWQRGLIPLHLFAQRILLPGLDEGSDVKIAAQLPDYFVQTMENCNLMFNRAKYEEEMIGKKKPRGQLRDSIFVSKGIIPITVGRVTSL